MEREPKGHSRRANDLIGLEDPYRAQHWAKVFGLTRSDLAAAVHTAGPRARDVALLLRVAGSSGSGLPADGASAAAPSPFR